jgi:YHS domain-containing protein
MLARRDFVKRLSLAALLVSVPGTAAWAQSDAALRVVLKGYDPVAYFTEGRPVKGSPQFKFDFDGERYHFASAANRDRFAADPDRYAPQFGGYCTGTMAKGAGRNEGDPEAWIIVDGKLYLFGQVRFRDIALTDPAWLSGKVVVAANDHWRGKK